MVHFIISRLYYHVAGMNTRSFKWLSFWLSKNKKEEEKVKIKQWEKIQKIKFIEKYLKKHRFI